MNKFLLLKRSVLMIIVVFPSDNLFLVQLKNIFVL